MSTRARDRVESASFREVKVQTLGLRLAAKLWTVEGAASSPPRRAVCVPGWLDNAGSFDNIVPLLLENSQTFTEILCVDPPGCGLSDHASSYSGVEEPPMLLGMLVSLGWSSTKVALICHSRGGGIGAWFAGCFAEHVCALVVFDSDFSLFSSQLRFGLPGFVDRGHPARLHREAFAQHFRNLNRPSPVYSSLEAAVTRSMTDENFPKSKSTATNIVSRHLVPCAGGYTATFDVRTYGQRSWLGPDENMTLQVLNGITCPVLQILAKSRLKGGKNSLGEARSALEGSEREQMKQLLIKRRNAVPNIKTIRVTGGHHLHSDNPEECSEQVIAFFEKNEIRFSPTDSQLTANL